MERPEKATTFTFVKGVPGLRPFFAQEDHKEKMGLLGKFKLSPAGPTGANAPSLAQPSPPLRSPHLL